MSDQEQKIFGDYKKPADQVWTIPGDDEEGVYRFILAAARRARQLQGGARPSINTSSRKPTKIAMEEVRQGEVKVEIIPEDQPMPSADLPGAAGLEPLGNFPQARVFLPDE